MSKSGQLRLHDIRDAYRLIRRLPDLGMALCWLAHLMDADIVTGGEGRWPAPR